MKVLIKIILFLFMAGHSSLLLAQAKPKTMPMHADSMSHVMMRAANLKWMNAPPGLPPGAKVAVLSGDPSKEGTFTIRLMLPANYTVKPHWHPTDENITVVKGTLYMGMQETFNKEKATRLNEGDFARMPARSVHYAFSKTPVTVQIHGMGPFAITYIKASDDPRNSKMKMP